MHLLSTASTTLDDLAEPVDLAQPPGDVTILSFADSDLVGLAAAWEAERDASAKHSPGAVAAIFVIRCRSIFGSTGLPAKAKVIVVRLLGGLDWWRYGIDRFSALARERGIVLALLARRRSRRSPARRGIDALDHPSWRPCCRISGKAAATISARCSAASPAMRAPRFVRSPARVAAHWRVRSCRDGVITRRPCSRACREHGRWFRSFSIDRC